MSYDGEMLSLAVTQAIVGLPGAIKSLKDLLSSRAVDNNKASEDIEKIRKMLIQFCEVEPWLLEAKRLHEHLQALDTQLEGVRLEFSRATAKGKFDDQEYNIAEIRKDWEIARRHALIKIINLGENVTRLNKVKLKIDSAGNPECGPEWAIRFVEFKNNIDDLFAKHDKREHYSLYEMANLMRSFCDWVSKQMNLVDERIRNEAMIFGSELSKLSSSLRVL